MHYDNCKESVQGSYLNKMDNKCQCMTSFKYDGAHCLGSLGMYVHTVVTVCSEYEAPAAADDDKHHIVFMYCYQMDKLHEVY